VKVRGALDNKDRRLKAEMFITAALKIPAAKGLVVPTRAVYLRGDQYFVFCDAGGGRYVRKAVRIGPSNNGQQVLLDGIDAGAKVVVEGNLQLDKILAAKE
jgi:cobalt-zinc-cadmium efflux system membrane fusion protein